MKRIIYFISILLIPALYSCTGQYDNIEQYATDETVYVGKFSDMPFIRIGYKRVEIELLGDSIGRAYADDIYLGKAKKTVVEYDEADGTRRREFDSVCSWVNITGLTTPKTYIFTIYAEDELGHKSISTEALGKPFTDADFAGITFPEPHVIPAPTTVEFVWDEVSMGLSSPLFKFIELIYSYENRNGVIVSGKLTAKDAPSFNIKNLNLNDSTSVIINCRIIPIAESGLILDTLPMVKEFFTKTATEEEYLSARTLRPISSAMINPAKQTEGTIIFSAKTDHLAWTDIRYKKSDNNWQEILHIDNNTREVLCQDIKREEIIQIRCTYNPPETDLLITGEWTDYAPFIMRHDTRDWVVIPRNGSHNWGSDGSGTQTLWSGGNPMLILDNDAASGWHSHVGNNPPFPQVLIIDMKEVRRVSKVIASGGYWNTVQLYLTNDLSMPGYYTYSVDWDDANREGNYNNWVNRFTNQVPGDVPESWGAPVAQGYGEQSYSFLLSPVLEGRFLILRFPDNNVWREDWPATYIAVNNFEVYSD
jgi:hypothetical protein